MTSPAATSPSRLASGLALALGLGLGSLVSPAGSSGLAAQQEVGPPPPAPVWESTTPAPRTLRSDLTLWPHQPTAATHWSIHDIRAAHDRLAEAERDGRSLDPNTTLHDFPYWTRTHSLFIRHAPQGETGDTAEQHLGYAQFLVVMGGTGEIRAGGRLLDPAVLIEEGRAIPGELRGPAIDGADRFMVGPGDWVSIPPDTPTQVTTNADGGLTYMVMKVNAMLYPWELIR